MAKNGTMKIEALPADRRATLVALRDGFREAFGDELFALYVYGALTFPETEGVVDLDYHVILERPPDAVQVAAYEGVCAALARDHAPWGAELDGWPILRSQAGCSQRPEHALLPGVWDDSWALHRAHWLAGRCLVLHGPPPADVVVPPTWEELEANLRGELEYARRSPNDAFAVLNACRVLHSLLTRDVVRSKFGSAAWGLVRLPPGHHSTLLAAMAAYRGDATRDDATTLARGRPALFESVERTLDY